jgi:hypothetical protein
VTGGAGSGRPGRARQGRQDPTQIGGPREPGQLIEIERVFREKRNINHVLAGFDHGFRRLKSHEPWYGTHHKVSRVHLDRYLGEFEFRYSTRKFMSELIAAARIGTSGIGMTFCRPMAR